jgi:hypothetical protein
MTAIAGDFQKIGNDLQKSMSAWQKGFMYALHK